MVNEKYDIPTPEELKAKKFATIPNDVLCRYSITNSVESDLVKQWDGTDPGKWETNVTFLDYVNEAKRRNFTIEYCKDILTKK